MAAELDPKAFFMMLNANYAVLYRDGVFDLTPLWEALAQQHEEESLVRLFLRFASTLQAHGLSVALPPVIAGLSPEQQQAYLEAVGGSASSEAQTVSLTDELEGLSSDAPNPPLVELEAADLRPHLDGEARREIVSAVIQAVKAAPVGERVDTSQLAYLVDSNFDTLCDGQTFDLDPILGGLRDLGNVYDRDLYLAPALLKEALRPYGINVSHQKLDVSDAEGRQLLEIHHRARAKAKRDVMIAVNRNADQPAGPPSASVEPLPRAQAREEKLREMGLGAANPVLVRRIRLAVLATLLVLIGLPSYLLRPDRELPLSPYEGTVPLKSAELMNHTFFGVLDGAKWWPLPFDQREKRLRAFEAIIKQEGLSAGLHIVDAKKQLVITGVGAGRLRGAPFLMRGRADGTLVDKPDYKDAGDVRDASVKKEEEEEEKGEEEEKMKERAPDDESAP